MIPALAVAQLNPEAFDPTAAASTLLPIAIVLFVVVAVGAALVAYGKYRWRTRHKPERRARRAEKRTDRIRSIAAEKGKQGSKGRRRK